MPVGPVSRGQIRVGRARGVKVGETASIEFAFPVRVSGTLASLRGEAVSLDGGLVGKDAALTTRERDLLEPLSVAVEGLTPAHSFRPGNLVGGIGPNVLMK